MFLRLIAFGAITITTTFATSVYASEKIEVGITAELKQLDFTHDGKQQVILRNQDQTHTVTPSFAKTSRPCPPFCVQPMKLAPDVETVGELEVIDFIKRMTSGNSTILVVDSRTPDWVERGTIPSAMNIPWTKLNPAKGATTEGIIEVMTGTFGVKLAEGADSFAVDEAIVAGNPSSMFDFSEAKTLVMFCNGMWCGQSPTNIKILLKFGYPSEKLKWYRGGMQAWEILGFNTVKVAPN